MSVGANSYGTAAGVAALAKVYARAGQWYDYVAPSAGPPVVAEVLATNPSLTQVETWLDNVSAMMNMALANEGFTIPVSQTDAKAAITLIINTIVADVCAKANAAERFYSDGVHQGSFVPMAGISKQIDEWVKTNVIGLVAFGVTRSTQSDSGLSAGVILNDFADHNEDLA